MALAVLKRGLASMHIDEEQVYHKTKLLLKIYRDVVWCIEDRVCEIEAEYYAMGGSRLAEALITWMTMTPISIRKTLKKSCAHY